MSAPSTEKPVPEAMREVDSGLGLVLMILLVLTVVATLAT